MFPLTSPVESSAIISLQQLRRSVHRRHRLTEQLSIRVLRANAQLLALDRSRAAPNVGSHVWRRCQRHERRCEHTNGHTSRAFHRVRWIVASAVLILIAIAVWQKFGTEAAAEPHSATDCQGGASDAAATCR